MIEFSSEAGVRVMMKDSIDSLFDCFDSQNKRTVDGCLSVETVNLKRSKITPDTEEEGGGEKKEKRIKDKEETFSADQDKVVECQDVLIETYESDTNCLHECVRLLSSQAPLKKKIEATCSRAPAREFPYVLDKFQSTAIRCLEEGESVLVSAHTSAGKTTVAEYAIAMSLRDKQRVIYTSPIKALSNQKYRDLSNLYGNHVGLLTGDVSLNPSASVMVMTTEILRSMLYRGSEMIREMKWVIFDEIHYMRDRERGVVWEETIILLPDTVRLVFLSATIPNAREFIEWICRIKHQPCHAIYTDYRPVPLQHYVYPVGSDGLHLVMDEKKEFREDQFEKAVAELKRVNDVTLNNTKLHKGTKNVSDIEKIVIMCHEREVEANALKLKNVCLTTPEEQELIETVFNNAMDSVGEDRYLPQITCMLPLLTRGIGLHHGGLLPIVKEVIEILFQESLVKVLFSTETFSMGVNMPAKTVVFTKLRKWDGTAFRMISAGEYIQMSGRAGRRGLDTRGLAIIMLDERLDSQTARKLYMGQPLRINSQFHLGYNMLLNLLRVEGANPEYMMRLSFYQFQRDKEMLQFEENKKKIEQQLVEFPSLEQCLDIDQKNLLKADGLDLNVGIVEYYSLQRRVQQVQEQLRDILMLPKYVLRFLQVGRIVRVCDQLKRDRGYGILIQSVQKKHGFFSESGKIDESEKHKTLPHQTSDASFLIHVLVRSLDDPQEDQKNSSYEILSCTLPMLTEVTQVVANISHHTGTSPESRQAVGIIFDKISDQLQDNFPALDPIKHMKVEPKQISHLQMEIEETQKKLRQHPLHGWGSLSRLLTKFEEKLALETEKKRLEDILETQKHLVMKEDLRAMRRVLRSLDYLDDENLVTLKGRAACEISSVDELVMCELLFQNVFHNLDKKFLVALLSCFVFDEKADDILPSDPKLLQIYERVQGVAQHIAEVSVNSRLSISAKDYVNKFKAVLMQIVLKWMEGAKFSELEIPEDLFEGSVVRAMRRLEELLRQLISAAKSIGEHELETRLADAVKTIRRGIVFSPSLYI